LFLQMALHMDEDHDSQSENGSGPIGWEPM
jgi:hypothetical protein